MSQQHPSLDQATLSAALNTTTMPDPTTILTSHPPQSYTYYHAGPLFTVADLTTNVHLSRLISHLSHQKFIPILPQDLESRSTHPHHIRDQDIRALLACDLALFTYDGAELDAGTVVEYMVAKMADVPTVILRTDFRGGGDQQVGGDGQQEGDSWNLMSSFWPRTKCVSVDSMAGYKLGLKRALEAGDGGGGGAEGSGGTGGQQGAGKGGRTAMTKSNVRASEMLLEDTARKCVQAMEEVLKEKVKLKEGLRQGVYEWLALMPGLREGTDEENVAEFKDVLKRKVERGLL